MTPRSMRLFVVRLPGSRLRQGLPPYQTRTCVR
jgi:hypothetical protein